MKSKKEVNRFSLEICQKIVGDAELLLQMAKDMENEHEVKMCADLLNQQLGAIKQINNARKIAFQEDKARATYPNYKNTFFEDEEE